MSFPSIHGADGRPSHQGKIKYGQDASSLLLDFSEYRRNIDKSLESQAFPQILEATGGRPFRQESEIASNNFRNQEIKTGQCLFPRKCKETCGSNSLELPGQPKKKHNSASMED